MELASCREVSVSSWLAFTSSRHLEPEGMGKACLHDYLPYLTAVQEDASDGPAPYEKQQHSKCPA